MATLPVITVDHDGRPRQMAMGGGMEAADRTSRETALWNPSMGSTDQIINPGKRTADARGRDMVLNDGRAMGGVDTYRDAIVGAQYRLNARPNWRALGATAEWAEEFQQVVEAKFTLLAESPACYLDAQGIKTFTDIVRQAVGSAVITGEVLGTVEWITNDRLRPLKTAVQMISPDRLSNPWGVPDSNTMRRGIERDTRGRPIAYHIQTAHPSELLLGWNIGSLNSDLRGWTRVLAQKPWGRKQVLHFYDQTYPDQSRGVAAMVAALKQMRMTKKFQEVTLQNAIINASYAASIESELPDAAIVASMGGSTDGTSGLMLLINNYLTAMSSFLSSSNNIAIDGAKIPHLFPGTKLNLKPMGTPGGVGSEFEASLLRHTASALGISFEEFARDYSKTSYSGARASLGQTQRRLNAVKKLFADRIATAVYFLVLEEWVNAGEVPLPGGRDASDFYLPLRKEAYGQCSWIGSGWGQIDEMKETQAAILRVKSGLSTYEYECARLGTDFREIFEQRAREEGLIKQYGLTFQMDATKQGSNQGSRNLKEDDGDNKEDDDGA